MEKIDKLFGDFCVANNLIVVTAESCTAGLLAGEIANISGSSKWLDRGFVVYTALSKVEMLDVDEQTINKYNVVSVEVANEMAIGALDNSNANFSMAVTGVAGPGGGSEDIPVGTICMAWAFTVGDSKKVFVEKKIFNGDRNSIRKEIVQYMLKNAISLHNMLKK